VLDGAKAMLIAHGILTRHVRHVPLRNWILKRALPFARGFKKWHDRGVLKKLRKEEARR